MKRLTTLLLIFPLVVGLAACGGGTSDADSEGQAEARDVGASGAVTAADIGPVKQVDLGPIEEELAEEGEEIFNTRCKTCHRLDERYVGPPLRDVTERRGPVYIMNMILNPEGMIQKHPDTKQLMAEYGTMMTNQNLSQDQARALLEYLRQVGQPSEETDDES